MRACVRVLTYECVRFYTYISSIAPSGAARTIVVGVYLGKLVATLPVTSSQCVQPLNTRWTLNMSGSVSIVHVMNCMQRGEPVHNKLGSMGQSGDMPPKSGSLEA